MNKYLTGLIATIAIAAAPEKTEAAEAPSVGIVKFRQCVESSKAGKQEQEVFESLKNKMAASMERKEKELSELAKKFQDPDYMDSLSSDAEAEMKHKFRSLSQEMGQYQNEFYQQMNQANMRILQHLSQVVSQAANEVAEDLKLDMIVNEDNVFYFAPTLDVTTQVIEKMDDTFEKSQSTSAS